MSQTGNVVSCTSVIWWDASGNALQAWSLQFNYQTDAGALATYQVLVGNNIAPHVLYDYSGPYTLPVAALWTSPTSFITVSPNPPGTTNPVQLPCPPIVKAAAFGLPWV